jgi:hypothetical protein
LDIFRVLLSGNVSLATSEAENGSERTAEFYQKNRGGNKIASHHDDTPAGAPLLVWRAILPVH